MNRSKEEIPRIILTPLAVFLLGNSHAEPVTFIDGFY